MLSKGTRIQKKDFSNILKVSKRKNSPHFTLYFASTNPYKSRFSVSVSKKVANRAAVRNKVRRRVYSIISKYMLNINKGYFFIFVCKKGIENVSFTSLDKEAEGLIADFFV